VQIVAFALVSELPLAMHTVNQVRVRIVRTPTATSVDAIRLDSLRVGNTYDVGNALGAYLLAQGWAEPADTADDPLIAESNPRIDPTDPTIWRECEPPRFDLPPRPAAERRLVDRRRLPDRRGPQRDDRATARADRRSQQRRRR